VAVVGLSIVVASSVLYLLSRIPELLLITGISLIYAAAPMMTMMLATLKHL